MPPIEHPNDAIVRVTMAAICGSDLHLYHGMMPDTRVGMTFGHEFRPTSPVGNVVGGVTNTVGGVTGGLTGAVSGVLGGLAPEPKVTGGTSGGAQAAP
jgi:D-arabinose 1-dehydrogenase-like Zn-dependent alcohol dehydrogenase